MNSFKSISQAMCLCIMVIFLACKNEKAAEEVPFFTFVHHTKNEGVKPVEGDLVSFRVQAFIGDSLVQASEEGSTNKLKIPVNSESFYKQNPLYYAFQQMSENDSASLTVIVDSLDNIPLYAKSGDKITYNFVIAGIQSGGIRDFTKEQLDSVAATRIRGENAINAANKLSETIANWDQQDATGTRVVNTTTSGIEYLIISRGTKGLPKGNDWVSYKYVVKDKEGNVIANTFRSSKPENSLMDASKNMPAINELMTLIPIGATVVAKVPAKLGYKTNDSDTPGDQILLLEIISADPYDKAIQQ
jgi:FKBP-type peptidyl-prolyl cis-trans isomerase